MFLRRYIAALALVAMTAFTTACMGPQPGNWSESDWPHTRYDVSEITVSILKNKFDYQIEEYEEDGSIIRMRTAWNARGAHKAIFAGSGMRRMAFVEIEETYNEANLLPSLPSEDARRSEAGEELPRRVKVVDGEPKLVMTRLSLSIIAERNVSIIDAGNPDKGDWQDAGSDKEEIEQVLASIRLRLRELSGREFGMSDRAKKAHERYLKEENLTAEEREKLYNDLKRKDKEQ